MANIKEEDGHFGPRLGIHRHCYSTRLACYIFSDSMGRTKPSDAGSVKSEKGSGHSAHRLSQRNVKKHVVEQTDGKHRFVGKRCSGCEKKILVGQKLYGRYCLHRECGLRKRSADYVIKKTPGANFE